MAKVGDIINRAEPGWSNISFGNSSITYTGMTKGVSYAYGWGTASYSFTFTGTAVRIITGLFSDGATNAQIKIDNTVEYANFKGTSADPHIVYEKTKLPYGTHTITVRSNGSGTLSLMAIHYAAFAKVGDVLTQPEPGWTRVDDANSLISYIGDSWKLSETSINYYNQTNKYRVQTTPGSVEFSFKGTGIRIVSTMYAASASKNWPEVSIEIDGVTIGEYAQSNPDITKLININQVLLFEKTGLTDRVHKIKLSGTNMNMDAFDILGGNIVKPPAKVGDVLQEPESGWKRFDDTDSNIKYVGNTWQSENSTSAGYYKNTLHFKHSNFGSEAIKIQFSFIGSRLRIIALSMSSYDRNATIKIDDKPYNLSYYNKEPTKQCLIFEELNLEYGSHTVSIEGLYLNLDAIDIDADGFLFTPAKVGDVLKEPEHGWKRFDDTDSNIKYTGVWATENKSIHYNSTCHYKHASSNTPPDSNPISIKFNFEGTKLRIIGFTGRSYDSDAKILIDGKEEVINFKLKESVSQCLVYEKLNLPSGVHTVEIKGIYMTLDAIDIDADGFLFTPTQIGDVLKEPESGWKRFDDRDPNILYQGNWIENENITTHYRGTFHNKPSSSGDDSIVKALFDFSGTKVRIIAFMTTGSYDVGTIKIDGEAFNFSYIKGTPTAQCLVFEKAGLEQGVHKVELSGRYINLDAIDIDETGELIPIEIKKPKVSLYEKESGKVFVDDFDSINPKWLMSPFTAFNNMAKPGFLRMNHSADKDALLLIDKPQGDVAIQVIADYVPTKEGDEGGLLIYKNEANNIEFLESMKVSDSPDPKEWMAVCKENQWDFYNKTDITFDYVRSEQLEAHKIGVVLKKGNAEGFTPLDINKIIITTSNLLRLRQLYEKYKVVLKDAAENVISTSFVEAANTGIDIPLPSLEFEGIVEIYDEDGTLVAKRQTTFFGGDMYCMGSSLHISMDTKELDETDPTHLGYMTEIERLVKMTLTNDNVGPVTNVKVAIQQYMEKFGYTWAHLSLDGSHYTDELAIETLDAGSSKDFWVKIIKDVNYMAFEPIYFNIHLSHE